MMRFILLVMLLSSTVANAAESFPTRPITVIVTTAPGGLIDLVARAVCQRLSERWKQPVVIENKSGAGHIVGAVTVAKARPDGYTLMMTESGTLITNPTLHRKNGLPYKASDFVAVAGLARYTQALIANPSFPANSVSELIALAKAKPASVSYGTSGVGSAPHMNMALFQSLAHVSMVPVHYRGAAPALGDVIAGHIPVMSVSLALSVQNVKAGQIKMLAVGSDHRFDELPDVPTVAESGLPGYKAETWIGAFAPRDTPTEIVAAINKEIGEVLDDPATTKLLKTQMVEPFKISPAEFAAYVSADEARWGEIIREQNLSVD